MDFTKLTDIECKRLASEIFSKNVFCNYMVKKEDQELIPYIFEPILTEDFITFVSNNQDKIGLVYEYYKAASVKKLFKYNVFFTMKIIDIDTAMVVNDYLDEFKTKSAKQN